MDDRQHRPADGNDHAAGEGSALPLFSRVFKHIVTALDVPFGYTLSMWAAGHLAIERYGFPSVVGILLFVSGGIAAYLLMAALASIGPETGRRPKTPKVALLNVMALITAVVVSAVTRVAEFHEAGFLIAGFVATFVYAILLTILNYLGLRFRSDAPRS